MENSNETQVSTEEKLKPQQEYKKRQRSEIDSDGTLSNQPDAKRQKTENSLNVSTGTGMTVNHNIFFNNYSKSNQIITI